MKIGIIGSGHIGGTLARKFVEAGHEVGISNSQGPESLRDFGAELGPSACPMTVQEAADFGDIVVVSVPLREYQTIPAEPLAGKIVIDTLNYYPDRDGHYEQLDTGASTSSEMVQAHLRDARVVKAFNMIRWTSLRDESRPAGDQQRLGIGIAGDDPEAKQIVAGLIEEIGFDPVDTGGLAFGGRRLQPGSSVYTAHLTAHEMKERLAA